MISGYAWSDEPVSGIPDDEDISAPNPLTDLLSDPRAKLAFMLRARPFDPVLGAERDVFLSDCGYTTLDDGGGAAAGVPDHTPFPAALVSAYNVKVNLLSGGLWQASAVPGYGAIVIANPDGRHDDLTALNWELRTVTIWLGRQQWIGPSFSQLGRVFQGTVDSLTWTTQQITVNVRDLRQLFEQDINPEAYLGFGTAVRFRSAGDRATIPYGTWTRPVDADSNPLLAVEFMVCEEHVRDSILCTQGGSAGWAARVHTDGSVGLYDRDLTNWIRTAPGAVKVGVPVRVGLYGSPEGLRIRLDGLTAASNSTPYSGPLVVADVVLGGGPL